MMIVVDGGDVKVGKGMAWGGEVPDADAVSLGVRPGYERVICGRTSDVA